MRNDDEFGGAAGGTGGAARSPYEGATQGNGPDRVREALEEARETASEKAHKTGERARDFRMNMADKLESGAQRLRQRASGMGRSDTALGDIRDDGPAHHPLDSEAAHKVERTLADGMESTADWIRTADLESIRGGIESQVREHPARTLLVALGVGYLIGRAFGGGEKESRYGDRERARKAEREPRADREPHSGLGPPGAHGLH